MKPTERLTERAKGVLLNASGSDSHISVDHIIVSIQKSGGMGAILLQSNPKITLKRDLEVDLNILVEKAFYHSVNLKHNYVGTEHLLLALLELGASPDIDILRTQVLGMNVFPNFSGNIENREDTPILNSFGENLSDKYQDGYLQNISSREEIEGLVSILLRDNHPNVLLVGDKGVGKGDLVELLVHRIETLNVPVALASCQVIEFDVMSFIASLSNKESIDFGLTTLLSEIAKVGDVILYIKDFQNVFISTNTGFAIPLAFSLLRKYLEQAKVSIIGSIESPLYDKLSSESIRLFDSFEEIVVEEPSIETIKRSIINKAKKLQRFHGVQIPSKTVDYAVDKVKEANLDTKMPQSVEVLLDIACTKVLIEKDLIPNKYKRLLNDKIDLGIKLNKVIKEGNLTEATVLNKKQEVLEKRMVVVREGIKARTNLILTPIEVDFVLDEWGLEEGSGVVDIKHLSKVDEKISKRIIGQEEAVNVVTKALIRAKLGLRARKRPLGNFLFLGPTGVGKTELAKVLASEAFGEDNLIRLDMSDFAEKHNVARLVGAPPGYVGFGEGGELTTKIENKPDSVVLFDEIEKAHPDVLNILLQIMEEGELSDAKGNIFDFSKAVVILTSNIGTQILQRGEIGFDDSTKREDQIENRLKENLKKIMKAELLNRFDEVIVFKRLNKSSQKKVLDLLLKEVRETLKKQDIKIKLYADAKKYLLEKGYSDEYGARALRRVIERDLLDKIAQVLLEKTERPLSLKAFLGKSGQLEVTI